MPIGIVRICAMSLLRTYLLFGLMTVGISSSAVLAQSQSTSKIETASLRDSSVIISTSESRGAVETQDYRVAPGDVLTVKISGISRTIDYFVRYDGTIDLQLGGGSLFVSGDAISEIQKNIADTISFVSDPTINVKVKKFGSHEIDVSGEVELPGIKNLSREAVPFFVVRAETMPLRTAKYCRIIRGGAGDIETFSLSDPKLNQVLLKQGDSVVFLSEL